MLSEDVNGMVAAYGSSQMFWIKVSLAQFASSFKLQKKQTQKGFKKLGGEGRGKEGHTAEQ
jgi:hypothetical protein